MQDNTIHHHSFEGSTSFVNGHHHYYSGKTSDEPNLRNHFHYIEGDTMMSDGHMHHYKIETSPAYYERGKHFHYYRYTTDLVQKHTHFLQGYVSEI